MSELGELHGIRNELTDIKMTLRELVYAIKQLDKTVTIELPYMEIDDDESEN